MFRCSHGQKTMVDALELANSSLDHLTSKQKVPTTVQDCPARPKSQMQALFWQTPFVHWHTSWFLGLVCWRMEYSTSTDFLLWSPMCMWDFLKSQMILDHKSLIWCKCRQISRKLRQCVNGFLNQLEKELVSILNTVFELVSDGLNNDSTWSTQPSPVSHLILVQSFDRK